MHTVDLNLSELGKAVSVQKSLQSGRSEKSNPCESSHAQRIPGVPSQAAEGEVAVPQGNMGLPGTARVVLSPHDALTHVVAGIWLCVSPVMFP